jgi:hypothetical protein
VSKHTTCDDVDEGGVKRLVGVPVRRCRRRDVDVSAVLLGTDKARKNRNPNTHVNAQKIWGKKNSQMLSKFGVNGTNGCQKGDYGVKRGQQVVKAETNCCRCVKNM